MIVSESIDGIEIAWSGGEKTLVVPLLTRDEYQAALEHMRRAEDDPEGLAPFVCAAAVIRAALVRRYGGDAPSILDVVENLEARDLVPLWDELIDLSLLANASCKVPQ